MLEATDRAREGIDDITLQGLVAVDRDQEAGDLPDPSRVVPDRAPEAVSKHPVSQAYRDLFWSWDVDPTKQRPAGQALARRLAQGKPLPRIHPLVDAYNLASAASLVSISAFDAGRLEGQLTLDLAEAGEAFEPIGDPPTTLEAGRPVWRDAEGVVSLLFHRDGQRTRIQAGSQEVLLVAGGPSQLAPRVLPEAVRTLESLLQVVHWRLVKGPVTLEL